MAIIPSASAAGSASMTVKRKPQSSNLEYSAIFLLAKHFDREGNNIVPSAAPNRPEGNSISLSA